MGSWNTCVLRHNDNQNEFKTQFTILIETSLETNVGKGENSINPLPNDKILDLSKFKAIADAKINVN